MEFPKLVGICVCCLTIMWSVALLTHLCVWVLATSTKVHKLHEGHATTCFLLEPIFVFVLLNVPIVHVCCIPCCFLCCRCTRKWVKVNSNFLFFFSSRLAAAVVHIPSYQHSAYWQWRIERESCVSCCDSAKINICALLTALADDLRSEFLLHLCESTTCGLLKLREEFALILCKGAFCLLYSEM